MSRRTMHAAAFLALALAACKTADRGTSPSGGGSSATEINPGQQIATVDGQPITYGDIDKTVGTKVRQAEVEFLNKVHELRSNALDEVINQRIMEAEAKAAGKTSAEQWFQTDFWPGLQPSEDEAKKFYDENSSQMGGRPYEQVKQPIFQHLAQQKGRTRLEELRKKHNVSVTLPEPKVPRIEVAATGPSKGPQNAKVTIVEFSDFQCPFCVRVLPTLERVLKEYPNDVRVVFRQFPLNFHQQAHGAAQASLCAADQGKFWEMHDKLFAQQQKLQTEDLKSHAKELGLDAAAFDKCLDSGEKRAQVDADLKDGEKVGVNGTPAFFVNGIFLNGAEPFEKFKDIIDRELGKQN